MKQAKVHFFEKAYFVFTIFFSAILSIRVFIPAWENLHRNINIEMDKNTLAVFIITLITFISLHFVIGFFKNNKSLVKNDSLISAVLIILAPVVIMVLNLIALDLIALLYYLVLPKDLYLEGTNEFYLKIYVATFAILGFTVTAYVAHLRNLNLKLSQEQFQLAQEQFQYNQQKDLSESIEKRLLEATKLLESKSEIVRLGAFEQLFNIVEMALDESTLTQQNQYIKPIIVMLTNYVRQVTTTGSYQKKYLEKPSDEITNILTFFAKNSYYFKGFTTQLDLSKSYLKGLLISPVSPKNIFYNVNFTCCNLEELKTLSAFQYCNFEDAKLDNAILFGNHNHGMPRFFQCSFNINTSFYNAEFHIESSPINLLFAGISWFTTNINGFNNPNASPFLKENISIKLEQGTIPTYSFFLWLKVEDFINSLEKLRALYTLHYQKEINLPTNLMLKISYAYMKLENSNNLALELWNYFDSNKSDEDTIILKCLYEYIIYYKTNYKDPIPNIDIVDLMSKYYNSVNLQ